MWSGQSFQVRNKGKQPCFPERHFRGPQELEEFTKPTAIAGKALWQLWGWLFCPEGLIKSQSEDCLGNSSKADLKELCDNCYSYFVNECK